MYDNILDTKNRFRIKHCPCGKSNKDVKFIPFINFNDKGYCFSCDKSFYPENELTNKPLVSISRRYKGRKQETPKSTISNDLLLNSLTNYSENNFIVFLLNNFGLDETNKAIRKYLIGTSDHWKGSTIFWQKDKTGSIRSGKVMLYNSTNCKRVKEPKDHINWVHILQKIKVFNLKQCLFGEHLLKENDHSIIGLVESEKSAVIASIKLPEYTWLATGGKQNFKHDLVGCLKNRDVVLFPDLDAHKQWSEKAIELSKIANFQVSEFVIRHSENGTESGVDLADIILKNTKPIKLD
ncbi:MAG: DUF6371 domain-containing protein [Cyclobacteriaceae bacterium]|nr:DUF6371 domain-containing protein [Cyclobacteriaceae bacterium]